MTRGPGVAFPRGAGTVFPTKCSVLPHRMSHFPGKCSETWTGLCWLLRYWGARSAGLGNPRLGGSQGGSRHAALWTGRCWHLPWPLPPTGMLCAHLGCLAAKARAGRFHCCAPHFLKQQPIAEMEPSQHSGRGPHLVPGKPQARLEGAGGGGGLPSCWESFGYVWEGGLMPILLAALNS